jgi:signal transduction histidine kinase
VPERSTHRRWQRRVVTVFLVAVLLPCLFLAYLGIRSIKLEEQWQQQLVLQNLRTSLSTAIERTEESVHRHLRAVFDTLSAQTSLSATINPTALHAFRQASSFAEEVFIFDGNLRLLFPRSFRGLPPHGTTPGNLRRDALSEELAHGEQLEAQGAFRSAADVFSQALVKSSSTPERLRLLVRLARCQMKSHDLAGARRTYLQVIAEDRNLFHGEELPYALVAYEQLAGIEQTRNQPDSATAVLLKLYSSMIQRFDRFERTQFEYHATWIRTELEKVLGEAGIGSRSQIASLDLMAEEARSEAARASVVRPALVAVVDSLLRGRATSPSFQFGKAVINGKAAPVAFHIETEVRGQLRVVGIILRPAVLASMCTTILENTSVGPGLRLVLLRDEIGRLSAAPVVEGPFVRLAGLMPRDRIAIVGADSDPAGEITSRSMILYYALIGTVIAVVLLGIFFLLHDISREQELSRMKSEFISNLTHEIKTPIAAIRSLAGNVTEGWVTDGQKQQEYFHLIGRETVRLGHLVENTLDFSRIESGRKKYRMETLPARQVLERVVERFLALTDGQGVTITPSFDHDLPMITVDKEAIGQAIVNLLDNAVKYSPGSKIVELFAGTTGDCVVITVKDRGIGIAKRELTKIFEKFYRVEPAAGGNVPGSGIGLTLVKEIVEAHGGRVEVESEPQRGSAFLVYLPIVLEKHDADDSGY